MGFIIAVIVTSMPAFVDNNWDIEDITDSKLRGLTYHDAYLRANEAPHVVLYVSVSISNGTLGYPTVEFLDGRYSAENHVTRGEKTKVTVNGRTFDAYVPSLCRYCHLFPSDAEGHELSCNISC